MKHTTVSLVLAFAMCRVVGGGAAPFPRRQLLSRRRERHRALAEPRLA